jgi:PAS domain-containing protein
MVTDTPTPEDGPSDTLVLLHVGSDRGLGTAVADYLGRNYDVRVEHVTDTDTEVDHLDDAISCVLAAANLLDGSGADLLTAVGDSRATVPFILYGATDVDDVVDEATEQATAVVERPTDETGRARLADRVATAVEEADESEPSPGGGQGNPTGDADGGDADTVPKNTDVAPDDAESVDEATYRRFLADVLGGGDGATVVTDADGTVVWVDEDAAGYFGLDPEAAVGTPRREFVRTELAPTVANRSTFTARALEDRTRNDGEEFRCFVTSGPDRTARWVNRRCHGLDDGPFAGGLVERYTDVSDIVRTEAAVADLQRLVTADEPFEDRLLNVLGLGAERLGLPYGFVTAVEDRVQTVVSAVGDHPKLSPGASCPLGKTYCRRTLAADDLVALEDALAAGWGDDPAYEVFGLESYIGVPIEVQDGRYGTFCFAASRPRASFDDHEELFVEMAATWAGYELDRIETADS